MASSDRSTLLARAVPCNWPSCRNKTRDPSMYCVHHSRSSQHSTLEAYRDRATILTGMRAAGIAKMERGPNAEWVAAQRALARQAFDEYPEMREVAGGWTCSNAVCHDDTVYWMGDRVRIADGETVSVRGASLSRSGRLVTITPDGTDDRTAVGLAAFNMKKVAWQDTCARYAVLDTAGERYNDYAEMLAQLGLVHDPGTSVTFSSTGDDDVTIVEITEETPAGKMIERYEVEVTWGRQGDEFRHYTNVKVPSHRTRQTPGGHKVVEQMDSDSLARRQELIEDLMETSNLIARYSVHQDGHVYIPMGWTDRES